MKLVPSVLFRILLLVLVLASAQAHALCVPFAKDLCSVSCRGEVNSITSELVKTALPEEAVCALWQAPNRETLDILLKTGIDVNARTIFISKNSPAGRNALFRVISNNNSETFEFLTANHIDVNIQDSRGMTPLMDAAWNGRDKMVEALLKAGALPNVEDQFGETALCYAKRIFVRHQEKISELLKNAGGVCKF